MATLAIDDDELCVCLTGLETLAARYGGVRVPLAAVSVGPTRGRTAGHPGTRHGDPGVTA